MTRKEMVDQVSGWLGLQDTASFDETGLIDTQLHLGTIDLLARTKCVVRYQHLCAKAGYDRYILPHEILAIVEVDYGHVPKARRDESSYCPSFTLFRSDVLRVQPMPTYDGDIHIWAVLRPEKMTVDTDSPGDEQFGCIPDEFQDAIVTYALWKCADYADDSGSGQGERYRIQYEGQDGRQGRLLQIRSQVNRRGTARAPKRRVHLSGTSARGAWVG
jgi:hypothetical protein